MALNPRSQRAGNRQPRFPLDPDASVNLSLRGPAAIRAAQAANPLRRAIANGLLGIALLALVTTATGCFGTDPPAATLLDGRFVERTAEASLVTIDLGFQNFESDPLPLVDITYVIEVNGRRVNSSRLAAQATIPPMGTQQVRVPAVIPHAALETVPTGTYVVAISGSVTYIPPGAFTEALFDLGVRVPSVRFIAASDIEFPPIEATPLPPPPTPEMAPLPSPSEAPPTAPLPSPESRPDAADSPQPAP